MEKRLIDADALLDKVLRHYTEEEKKGNLLFAACEIKQCFADMASAATTIDAVEVVRCRECKHWKHFEHLGCTDEAKVCGLANYMIGANGYCLYGERRSEDE